MTQPLRALSGPSSRVTPPVASIRAGEERALRDISRESRCLFPPSQTCGIWDPTRVTESPFPSPHSTPKAPHSFNSLAWAGTQGEAVFSENIVHDVEGRKVGPHLQIYVDLLHARRWAKYVHMLCHFISLQRERIGHKKVHPAPLNRSPLGTCQAPGAVRRRGNCGSSLPESSDPRSGVHQTCRSLNPDSSK